MADTTTGFPANCFRGSTYIGGDRSTDRQPPATGVLGMLSLFRSFIANTFGSVRSPYATYRKLTEDDPYQLIFIFFLCGVYFFFISPIRLHTLHPFLLTLNTARLFTTSLGAYLTICGFFLLAGKVLKSTVDLRAVLLTWGYSLIPTLVWFFVTSLFYVVLPPPRTETVLGRFASLMFISFSLSLFFWKGLLYYLTLRFALKLDLPRIAGVSMVFFPLLLAYSFYMYKLGIFRVPFV